MRLYVPWRMFRGMLCKVCLGQLEQIGAGPGVLLQLGKRDYTNTEERDREFAANFARLRSQYGEGANMRIYAELAEKFDVSERHVLRVVARIRRQLEQESDRTSI